MREARRPHPALEGIDLVALEAFRAGMRRRYTDEEILDELRASAERLGRSPTMREFAADPDASVHPQTVIEHFGTWNAAKRARPACSRGASSAARSFSTSCGRSAPSSAGVPTAQDIEERRGRMASKSLIWQTFGSLAQALKEAGFDVPVGEEQLERAVADGAALARRIGRLPTMADWKAARGDAPGCSRSGRSTGSSTSTPARGPLPVPQCTAPVGAGADGGRSDRHEQARDGVPSAARIPAATADRVDRCNHPEG